MVSKKPKKLDVSQPQSSRVKASKPKGDENGIFTLYVLKSELDNDLNLKSDACLWHRDGNELLQKYLRLPAEDCDGIFFVSTPIYSIWEDERRDEYHEVKVKRAESDDDSKVQLVSLELGQDWEEHQHEQLIEVLEDSLISYDDGSSDGPLDENYIIIEEIYEEGA